MGNSRLSSQVEKIDVILNFIDKSSGLSAKVYNDEKVVITQNLDQLSINLDFNDVFEVLERVDADARSFLQVNYQSGVKILVTDNLIGFKPNPVFGLDLARLPKVVTTPDLDSVMSAIEDSLESESDIEVDVLKRVFQSILEGAETVGFKLSQHRERWLRLTATNIKASA